MTPFEQLFGVKPNCGHLRAYGCVAYAYNFDVSRKKLDDRGIKCILVGYDLHSSAYLLYVPTTRKIIKSGHVAFNEFKTYYIIKDNDPVLSDIQVTPTDMDLAVNIEDDLVEQHVPMKVDSATALPSSKRQLRSGKRPKRHIKPIVRFMNLASDVEPNGEMSSLEVEPDDIDMLFEDFDHPNAPKSFNDIKNWDDSTEWYDCVLEENQSLSERDVFIEIDPSTLPPGINIVKCRYILKRKSNGRYKARLVAKGFSQKLGLDYNKTFAPVVSKSSLRILLSLAAVNDWEIQQLDVKTAFLYGELKEDIYVEAPVGLGYAPGTILKLNKSLYGLKQAPREWNKTIHEWLQSQGWKRLQTDRGVYCHTNALGITHYLAL